MIATLLYAKMDDASRRRMFESVAGRLSAGRVGRPEDVAQAIIFVATNPYVTGSTVTVDGGATIAT